MKLRFCVLTVLIICMASSFAFADQAALTALTKTMPGLVAHYPLEGDYKDVGGKAIDGAQVGDAGTFGWTDGANGGKAVTIDSAQFVGSFVQMPAPIGSPFDTATATFVVWTKLDARDGNHWQAICERDNLWYLETESNSAEWQGNAVVWRIYDPIAVGGGGSDQMRDNANVAVADDEWCQLAWTYDGAIIKGFVNGKQVITKDYAGGLGPVAGTPDPPPAGKGTNYNLSLGTWQQRDDWFKGAIDDFACFSSVLTEAQIQALYDAMMASASPVSSKDKVATVWGAVKN
jgi:hypothetical protein